MSVLQDLYDSEINISISTLWDGGYDIGLGGWSGHDLVAEGAVERWGQVEPWLTEQAIEHFPTSLFALMYRDGMSRWQAKECLRNRAAAALFKTQEPR